jgi:hypothetical protein
VAPGKQSAKVMEAFALLACDRPEATLALVGPSISDDETDRIRAIGDGLGLSDRVTVTGEVPQRYYATWLGRAAVGVQLRGASNGETSAPWPTVWRRASRRSRRGSARRASSRTTHTWGSSGT